MSGSSIQHCICEQTISTRILFCLVICSAQLEKPNASRTFLEYPQTEHVPNQSQFDLIFPAPLPALHEARNLLDLQLCSLRGFPGGAVVKNPPANAGDTRDMGSIPRSARSRLSTHTVLSGSQSPILPRPPPKQFLSTALHSEFRASASLTETSPTPLTDQPPEPKWPFQNHRSNLVPCAGTMTHSHFWMNPNLPARH